MNGLESTALDSHVVAHHYNEDGSNTNFINDEEQHALSNGGVGVDGGDLLSPNGEIDLNVYEDDDDETLHRKLIAAKAARKRAEEDHRLLSNRIALLKQEEQKVSDSKPQKFNSRLIGLEEVR